jgi:hypothetical protein
VDNIGKDLLENITWVSSPHIVSTDFIEVTNIRMPEGKSHFETCEIKGYVLVCYEVIEHQKKFRKKLEVTYLSDRILSTYGIHCCIVTTTFFKMPKLWIYLRNPHALILGLKLK